LKREFVRLNKAVWSTAHITDFPVDDTNIPDYFKLLCWSITLQRQV